MTPIDVNIRRHEMETFSTLLALCVWNSPVTGEFPSHRPVTRNFNVSLICVWTSGWVNTLFFFIVYSFHYQTCYHYIYSVMYHISYIYTWTWNVRVTIETDRGSTKTSCFCGISSCNCAWIPIVSTKLIIDARFKVLCACTQRWQITRHHN